MALLKNDTPTEAHPGENVGAEYLGQYEGAWLPRPGQQPPALGLQWKGEINKRREEISNEKKWSILSSAAALTRQYTCEYFAVELVFQRRASGRVEQ